MPLRLLAAFAIGAALPLMAGAAAQPQSPARLSDADRSSCLARQGRVMIAGRSGREMCALPYADGGTVCTNGSECEGACLVDEGHPHRSEGRLSGRCEPYRYNFGCRDMLVGGPPMTFEHICVD